MVEWQTRTGGSPLPSCVKMTMVPRREFAGKFSPLPFQDPIWKAIGAIAAEVSGSQLAAAATTGVVVGLAAGAGVATGTEASPKATVLTGVLVAVVVTGVVLMFLDGEDTFRWGEKHTDVDDDEFTIREEIEARLLAPPNSIPEVGGACPAEAEWTFTRYTNKRAMTCRDVVPISTVHYATRRDVSVRSRAVDGGEAVNVPAVV